MSHNDLVIQSPVELRADWRDHYARAMPGAILIERQPLEGCYLILPDDTKSAMVYDWGTVLASGVVEVDPGSLVCFEPYCGKWVSRPGWAPGARQVIILGGNEDWREQLVGIVEVSEDIEVVPRLKMTGKRVLLEREPLSECVNGVYRIDGTKARSGRARVLEVGPDTADLSPGDMVLSYSDSHAFLLPCEDVAGWYDCNKDDLMIVDQSAITLVANV